MDVPVACAILLGVKDMLNPLGALQVDLEVAVEYVAVEGRLLELFDDTLRTALMMSAALMIVSTVIV